MQSVRNAITTAWKLTQPVLFLVGKVFFRVVVLVGIAMVAIPTMIARTVENSKEADPVFVYGDTYDALVRLCRRVQSIYDKFIDDTPVYAELNTKLAERAAERQAEQAEAELANLPENKEYERRALETLHAAD